MFYKYILALIATVLILTPIHAEVDADKLEQRVKARWAEIIKYNFDEAYSYATPNYRAVFTKDLYVGRFSHGVAWNLIKVESVKFDHSSDIATVTVLVETKPRNSKGLDATVKTASVEIREKWLQVRGRWWHSSSE